MSSVRDTLVAPCDGLSDGLARWKKLVEAELKGAPFEKKLVTRTFEGVAIQPLYTRADLAGLPDLGAPPGVPPFPRGVRPHGYKDRPWEIAQEIAARSPREFNAALRADLAAGQNCVTLTPAPAARAAADAPAFPDVESEGLELSDLRDLSAALDGVELRAVPVHVRAGIDPLPLASLFLALARERGVAWQDLRGSVAADPIGEWIAAGRLGLALDACYDSLAGWTAWAARHAPHLRTIGVDGALWADAGGTAVHELAFALATAAEYLRALAAHGVAVPVAAERIRARLAAGPQFFTEIAKFRAWRLLWTRVVVAFGAGAQAAAGARVHACTARWNKTRLDPHVNLLRATTEALSAVLGGCDSLHVSPFDEAAGAPGELSRRIARNVHALLAEEFNFTQPADPAGGSWYVEKLTDELARRAWKLFQSIEARGGMAAALRDGFPQKLTADARAEKADAVGKRRLALIGTNLFPNLRETAPAASAVGQSAAAAKTAATRGAAVPTSAGWAARLEAGLAAARDGASLGQLARLSHALASAEWVIQPVKPWRAAAGFERVRAAAHAFAERTGQRPRVFLAKIGPPAQHKARADFSAGFFSTGGFEVLAKRSFETAEAAAEAAASSGAPVAVLCSTDETYPDLVPVFAREAKRHRPDGLTLVLAGLPADPATIASFRAAGIDEFIHLRANAQALLEKLLQQIGALP